MQKISFYTYCGVAGDLQGMLVGSDSTGTKVCKLYNRSIFPLWNLRRAKKKILKEFEILTGKKSTEG